MNINNLGEFTVWFDDSSADKLVSDWIWLIGSNKTPLMVSAMGDLFLRDEKDNIYLLKVGESKLNLVTSPFMNINLLPEKISHSGQSPAKKAK